MMKTKLSLATTISDTDREIIKLVLIWDRVEVFIKIMGSLWDHYWERVKIGRSKFDIYKSLKRSFNDIFIHHFAFPF